MGDLYSDPIETYLHDLGRRRFAPLTDEVAAVFDTMHAEAARFKFPIVGAEAGRVFYQLARVRRPRRILELGSGFGYSAIWWALGAGPQCEVHCTDLKLENIDRGQRHAAEAGVAPRIVWHRGDAIDIARSLPGPWDIVFVDIDKPLYPAAYDLMRPRMRPGDVLMFDNFLRHGAVALPREQQDAATAGVVALTDRLYADAGLATSLLSLRDGVIMAVALGSEDTP